MSIESRRPPRPRPRSTISIVDGVLDDILEIGLRQMPAEACGLIVDDGEGAKVIELENHAYDPSSAYVMRGEEMEKVLIEPVAGGLEHLLHEDFIVWHTHPEGQVGPSRLDLETRVEGITYLVVSWDNEGTIYPTLY